MIEIGPNKINQQDIIKKYGWTKKLIDTWLPEPQLIRHPRYKSSSPIKVWRIADVEAVIKKTRISGRI